MRTIGNIIWIVLGGWEAALSYAIAGAIFYLTIVGIPLGRISFRMAALSLTPFGKEITCGGGAPSMLANVVWFLLIGLWTAIYFAICGAVHHHSGRSVRIATVQDGTARPRPVRIECS